MILLLGLYASIALLASRHKGPSFDEAEEIAVGCDIWFRHDFRMEAANGDLVKRWATLPFLLFRPKFPSRRDPNWREGHPYALGYGLLYRSGNRLEEMLLRARTMNALLGIGLGVMVFICSREIFGPRGGLVSAALFSLSPHMLAFGGMVSTEISTCLMLLGSVWSLWRLLHRISWGRLAASLAFVSLAYLAKLSALVLIPAAAILVVIRLARGGPLQWQLGRGRLLQGRFAQMGIFAGLALLHAAAVWGALWTAYGFRYAASPMPNDPSIAFRVQNQTDAINPAIAHFIGWCRHAHFLPEGYLHGVEWLLRQNDYRRSFMDGHWGVGGWPSFFPYAFWAKTSPALLLLLVGGFAAWHGAWRKGAAEGSKASRLYAAVPFFVLIGIYTAIAMIQNVDIGHRHLLPIYPALDVLAGSAAFLWIQPRRWPRLALVVLLGAFAADSLRLYPDFLAYFSPVVGGPNQGYRRLVDSSLDWGMDLPQLRDWLVRHNPGNRIPLYLSYFGSDDPDHYKLHYRWLSPGDDWLPRWPSMPGPGLYAISATAFETVDGYAFGPWNPDYERQYQICLNRVRWLLRIGRGPRLRKTFKEELKPANVYTILHDYDQLSFGRLCAWLRHHRPPDAEVGHSILVWKLGKADLVAALSGPPAELTRGPPLDGPKSPTP
ncbi:MAG TPA: glycosyltransferase family 39 protein [Bryobacteraceae bacterium]|nr:glycosyltransferase family 39 protein [Bryobacteraceae bacterium]